MALSMDQWRAIDLFLVRWFNFSYLSRGVCKGDNVPPVSAFILKTKGRKSGNWTELAINYFPYGDNYVVLASNSGQKHHPAWYLNMEADPNCKVHLNWRTRNVRARVATGDERARIFADAAKAFPRYDQYVISAAPPEIPVVVLERQ